MKKKQSFKQMQQTRTFEAIWFSQRAFPEIAHLRRGLQNLTLFFSMGLTIFLLTGISLKEVTLLLQL